jgi:hypothetical protein
MLCPSSREEEGPMPFESGGRLRSGISLWTKFLPVCYERGWHVFLLSKSGRGWGVAALEAVPEAVVPAGCSA